MFFINILCFIDKKENRTLILGFAIPYIAIMLYYLTLIK